ncbi:hypothetical protein SELMODRAFT_416402 [Selaginella moellendorffii]|uniref:Uncharacterized protein n=1 Tax=Selaginella moellendorffii TaxID=88036 RepID=D8RZ64_SELML|nr:hypothetical protein SELMODRAFT_416402 [Selaginella moellendorffii]
MRYVKHELTSFNLKLLDLSLIWLSITYGHDFSGYVSHSRQTRASLHVLRVLGSRNTSRPAPSLATSTVTRSWTAAVAISAQASRTLAKLRSFPSPTLSRTARKRAVLFGLPYRVEQLFARGRSRRAKERCSVERSSRRDTVCSSDAQGLHTAILRRTPTAQATMQPTTISLSMMVVFTVTMATISQEKRTKKKNNKLLQILTESDDRYQKSLDYYQTDAARGPTLTSSTPCCAAWKARKIHDQVFSSAFYVDVGLDSR